MFTRNLLVATSPENDILQYIPRGYLLQETSLEVFILLHPRVDLDGVALQKKKKKDSWMVSMSAPWKTGTKLQADYVCVHDRDRKYELVPLDNSGLQQFFFVINSFI